MHVAKFAYHKHYDEQFCIYRMFGGHKYSVAPKKKRRGRRGNQDGSTISKRGEVLKLPLLQFLISTLLY